jgi:hypothetical protein
MDRKIFLVVDGHPAHKSKLVKRFVEDNAESCDRVSMSAARAAGAFLAIGVGAKDHTSPCHRGVELGATGGYLRTH